MDTTPPTSSIAPDAEPTIQTDILCLNCGYNLRTLKHTGLCPECAKPVRESMLSGGMQAWLRKVRRGITWLLVADIASACFVSLFFVVQFLPLGSISFVPYMIMIFSSLSFGVAWCVGLFLATRSSLQNALHEQTAILRLSIRIMAVLLLAQKVEQATSSFGIFWLGGIFGQIQSYVGPMIRTAAIICVAVYLAKLVVQWQPSLRTWARWWIGLASLSGIVNLAASSFGYYWYAVRSTAGSTPSVPEDIEMLLFGLFTVSVLLGVAAFVPAIVFLLKARKTLGRAIGDAQESATGTV